MQKLEHYVGQVLDEKYRLERLLGRGGMGAVYLATHLGTERYVALKLIMPQFMRNIEFVERFKREARAAGRLRHPNVVDVTDFGFARAGDEPVAYLVMEYLDGCTLADVLKEEKSLPLEWVVDILEQVCSAVHEAHQQGIVHRDLKPDNIWLEPNRLGGYRVKVLDFGIAKLAELDASAGDSGNNAGTSPALVPRTSSVEPSGSQPRRPGPGASAKRALGVDDLENETILYDDAGTAIREQSASRQASNSSPATPAQDLDADPRSNSPASTSRAASADDDTLLFTHSPTELNISGSFLSASDSTENDPEKTLKLRGTERVPRYRTTVPGSSTHSTELTRIGAIMGTPVYMSPEQCAAKNLDARSDIYSLGVIAYQMLAGEPPFRGETGNLIREHIEVAPPALRDHSKKIPKLVAQVVMEALAKDPADRPQTAAAFASALRAQSEGIGSLYRRAFALYSEYFPKFLRLSLIAHLPVIATMIVLIGFQLAERAQPEGIGVTKVALIAGTVIFGLLQVIGYFLASATISGVTAVIITQLSAAPMRPVELRTPFAVLKRRWRAFLNTSIRVTVRIIIGYILLVIPGIVMTVRYTLYAPVVLMEGLEKKAALKRARELASRSWRTVIIVALLQFLIPMAVSALIGRLSVNLHKQTNDSTFRVHVEEIYQQVSGLVNIVIVPLISIVQALLYLKMRQLGGETLSAALTQIEEVDDRSSNWQQRMRTRLSLPPSRNQKSMG